MDIHLTNTIERNKSAKKMPEDKVFQQFHNDVSHQGTQNHDKNKMNGSIESKEDMFLVQVIITHHRQLKNHHQLELYILVHAHQSEF